MKRILLLAVATLISLHLSAQQGGVRFETGTLQEALEKCAPEAGGPGMVMLDCYTSWCGPCKYMTNKVFPLEAAGAYFNARFVCIKKNMEEGEGKRIAEKYGIKGFPTFLFLYPDGSEVARVMGGGELDFFIGKVEKALDPANFPKNLLEKFETSHETDDALAYMESLKKNHQDLEIAAFLKEHEALFNQDALFDTALWPYLKIAVSLENPFVLDLILSNKYMFDYCNGREAVDAALYRALSQDLSGFLTGKRHLTAADAERGCDILALLEKDSYHDYLLLEAARAKAGGNPERMKAVLLDLENYAYRLNGMELVDIAYNIVVEMADLDAQEKTDFLQKYKSYLQAENERASDYCGRIK